MNINVYQARFVIKKLNDGMFAIVVRYGDKTFIACKGTLDYVKPKFLACVQNRQLLMPVIQRALAS